MSKVSMSDPKVWKTFVSSVTALIEEAAFSFSPDGIKMKAMDPSKISMVDFELSPEAFDEYSVKEKTVIGIKLTELERALSRMRSKDRLTLEIDTEKNRLNLVFKGASTRKLGIPILSMEEEEFPEPKLNFTAKVTVQADVLKDGLKDAGMVAENVRLHADKNSFSIVAESDRGTSELVLAKGDEGLIDLSVSEPATAIYSVKYLSDMIGGASASDRITLKFSTDLPLEIDFEIANGKFRFLLAPRVEA
jgi:proliferating cell nuclear antigen